MTGTFKLAGSIINREKTRLNLLLIRSIGQNQSLRVASFKKRSKRCRTALIHPVDTDRGIVHVRRGSCSVEVRYKVNVVAFEPSGPENASQVRRYVG